MLDDKVKEFRKASKERVNRIFEKYEEGKAFDCEDTKFVRRLMSNHPDERYSEIEESIGFHWKMNANGRSIYCGDIRISWVPCIYGSHPRTKATREARANGITAAMEREQREAA